MIYRTKLRTKETTLAKLFKRCQSTNVLKLGNLLCFASISSYCRYASVSKHVLLSPFLSFLNDLQLWVSERLSANTLALHLFAAVFYYFKKQWFEPIEGLIGYRFVPMIRTNYNSLSLRWSKSKNLIDSCSRVLPKTLKYELKRKQHSTMIV